jgi:hypothetical protein
MYDLPDYKTSRSYIQWFTNYRHQAESYTATILLKYILKENLKNIAYFSKLYFHISLQNCKFSDTNSATTS